jgi:hypothetical protein
MLNSGGRWVTASTGSMRSRSGWRGCSAHSIASTPSAQGRYWWRRRACLRSGCSRRHCAGAAPCSQCSHHSAFAIHEWLAADSDGRDVRDPGLSHGISCDPSGCIGKLADCRLVAYTLAPDAFEEDCRRATIIVATRDALPDCDATVIGRNLWRERGALALRREGLGFVIDSTRSPNFDRPRAPSLAPQPARTTGANSDVAAGSTGITPAAA